MGSRKSKLISPVTELTAKQVAEICRQTNLIDTEVHRRHSAFLQQYTIKDRFIIVANSQKRVISSHVSS
ncbi:unnamed protein product [Rotaria sp. Silwood2]|nr:unnamed protein product [Rotaria sp. Silwood2]